MTIVLKTFTLHFLYIMQTNSGISNLIATVAQSSKE